MADSQENRDAQTEVAIHKARILFDHLTEIGNDKLALAAFKLVCACKAMRRPEVAAQMDAARLERCRAS